MAAVCITANWGANVRFSNRPAGIKRFQAIHHSSVDVAREHTLLFGIGTRPLYGAFGVKQADAFFPSSISWFDHARPHRALWCGRDDDQRGARFQARFNRATTLYPVGPRTRTTMQSCASAAKLRSGGPILPIGIKAKGPVGNPLPRTVIGAPSQGVEQGQNCPACLQCPRFIVPNAKRGRPVQRPAARSATGRSGACAPTLRSWACEHRQRSRCEFDTTALRRFPSDM
jgi:hypothetical protein